MFLLRTGAPGSGKTLSLIHALKDGVKFPDRDEFRPIFYYGIPELSPQLGWTLLQDPKNWFNEVPDGAIVVIDEVQEHFPLRVAGKEVPAGLTAIERHRHRGLDLYFMTQHPSLLDVHARRLVNEHLHFKRNFGASFSVCYRTNECMNDPQDYHTLKKAERTTFKFPKSTFGLYKSAEVHTHKFKMPKIIYGLFFLIIFVFYMFYTFFNTVKHSNDSDVKVESNQSKSADKDNKSILTNGHRKNITLESFAPLIPNVPASSDLYQPNWQPKSAPIVSSCIGTSKDCRCYSQQGTLLAVSLGYCVYILANGTNFDHTLVDNRFKSDSNNAKHSR